MPTVDVASSNPLAPALLQANGAPRLNLFTLFPNLPLELRRMIFRETFHEPRHVYLDCHRTSAVDPYTSRRPLNRRSDLPVALHVCHETRTDALEHYQVVLQYEFGFTGIRFNEQPSSRDYPTKTFRPRKPFWFNSRVDTAYLNVLSDRHSDPCHFHSQMLGDFSSQGRTVASTVRILEIRTWRSLGDDSKLQEAIFNFNGKSGESLRTLLLMFKGLQTLCFTNPHPKLRGSIKFPATFLAEVEAWLEQNHGSFTNGKAPQVFLSELARDRDGKPIMPTIPLPEET